MHEKSAILHNEYPVGSTTGYPIVQLSDGKLHAKIALPDPERGYYRATRFDWGGVIRDLKWRSHHYFGEWFDLHDPLRHDGICGPVDEFSQIGYDEVPAGGEFLKIGVGILQKTSDEPYDRFQLYPILSTGERRTEISKKQIIFSQLLVGDRFGYDYHKTIRINEAQAELTIDYRLKNLGPASIDGWVYNHNFFTIDKMTTGLHTRIQFPFRPQGDWREPYKQVALTDDGIAFSHNLHKGESVFIGNLHGHDPSCERYQFDLSNTKSGAGVRVESENAPLSHLVFWACPTTPCIEPYTPLRIFAGETHVWRLRYRFYEFNPKL